MDFERRYPHPKLPAEYFIVRWTKGYRSAEIWYNNMMLGASNDTKQLLKGVKFNNENIGIVELKLEKDPYVLNVLLDGYHSPLNSKHPKKGIKAVSNWILPGILYYLLATIVIASLLFQSKFYALLDKTPLYYNISGFIIMLVVYILTRVVSPVALFVGVAIYVLQFVFFTMTIIQIGSPHFFGVILYLGYLAFVVMMIVLPVRRVISYLKHKKYELNLDADVLDN